MSLPYFPPPPTAQGNLSQTTKRKRISFSALPSPSDALSQVSKSRLALQKRIFANKFVSSQDQQRKDLKSGISRPITSPTRAKPPTNMLTTGSGQLIAVGLPSSPRMSPPKSPPPPRDQVGDLSVYSAFDPRPLPGPPPVVRQSYGSYHTVYEQSQRMIPAQRESMLPVRSIDEEFYMTTKSSMFNPAPPVQQRTASTRTRKQPPKAIQLPTKAASQWEVMSAPPVMYPQHEERQEEEEVQVHLDMSPAFPPWERTGARRARDY